MSIQQSRPASMIKGIWSERQPLSTNMHIIQQAEDNYPRFPSELFCKIFAFFVIVDDFREPYYVSECLSEETRHKICCLQTLRLVSRRFNVLASPFLFTRLFIRHIDGLIAPSFEFLEAIANGSSHLGNHVRFLRVCFPIEPMEMRTSDRIKRGIKSMWYRLRPSEVPRHVRVIETLCRVISKLPLLSEVGFSSLSNVCHCRSDLYWKHMESVNRLLLLLSAHPRVRSLRLEC